MRELEMAIHMEEMVSLAELPRVRYFREERRVSQSHHALNALSNVLPSAIFTTGKLTEHASARTIQRIARQRTQEKIRACRIIQNCCRRLACRQRLLCLRALAKVAAKVIKAQKMFRARQARRRTVGMRTTQAENFETFSAMCERMLDFQSNLQGPSLSASVSRKAVKVNQVTVPEASDLVYSGNYKLGKRASFLAIWKDEQNLVVEVLVYRSRTKQRFRIAEDEWQHLKQGSLAAMSATERTELAVRLCSLMLDPFPQRALVDSIDIFNDLHYSTKEYLQNNLQIQCFHKEEHMLQKDVLSTGMYFIQEGTVDVITYSAKGDVCVVATLQPHDFCGEHSLMQHEGAVRNATAVAQSEVRSLFLPKGAYHVLMINFPDFKIKTASWAVNANNNLPYREERNRNHQEAKAKTEATEHATKGKLVAAWTGI